MANIYTKAYLIGKINAGIRGKIDMLTDVDGTCNQAVREVLMAVDLRSTKKVSYLSPGLFSDIYSYPAPVDLKGLSIVSIRPQVPMDAYNSSRSSSEISLTTIEEFYREQNQFRCAVSDENQVKSILISVPINDTGTVISTLDSITAGGGTWTTVGDAINLVASTDYVVKGAASLKYDIGAGATTTAGIQNTTLTRFDITPFLANQVFHYEFISNATGITNYKLRIGSSASNYYEMTVTQTHEATSFAYGFNLLRFDFTAATIVGTPVANNCTYAAVYMTKDTTKINQTGFYADHLWLKKGVVYQMSYYSKYPWKTISGTYIENATTDADYIVAESDEIDMFIQKGIEIAAGEVDEPNLEQKARERFDVTSGMYLGNNPSESKLMQTTYYTF